jgi:hypothetical protein
VVTIYSRILVKPSWALDVTLFARRTFGRTCSSAYWCFDMTDKLSAPPSEATYRSVYRSQIQACFVFGN